MEEIKAKLQEVVALVDAHVCTPVAPEAPEVQETPVDVAPEEPTPEV